MMINVGCWKSSLLNRGFDEAVGEMELGGLGGLEARFESVAKGHELIDFGDYAVLFC